MKNLDRYPADTLTWSNGTGSKVTSGSLVEIQTGNDGFVGVAQTDIPDGESGALLIKGAVRNLAKKSGESWSQGVKLYWDSANGALTKTASSYTYAGRADADAGSSDTIGKLLLNA
jgi:predicted RecA/RadA family phage recombinase